MPQMAPMWWEIMFIIFSMIYICMSTMIYFSTNKLTTNQLKNKSLTNQYNWEW
uniref:ATP synthase complex subunit 8 n=1 Tax=Rubiconia intermedia TaxID=763267 RepID=A0A0H3VLE1_9HEMI|nr:ATP synthase F0 subunit 8 [Rubiconia intermedia]